MRSFLITCMTAAPLIGAVLISVFFRGNRACRAATLLFNLVALVFALVMCARFDSAALGLQFWDRYSWIPSLNIDYFVGIDGLGLLMVLLSAFVVPFAVLATADIERPHIYFSLLLLLQCGLFGAFTALNFFHWFLFWELSLVPAYFLIKLWGGTDRIGAATQFFVYTLVGSVTMLLGFMAIYLATDSFDFIRLAEMRQEVGGGLVGYFSVRPFGAFQFSGSTLAMMAFIGIFLGFAVKVPLFPFHTWLPRTYGEAPPAVTMVLTGCMSKMGVYGFVRILLPLFPEQMQASLTLLLWLAVATIVFSAFAALAQRDLRRMMAYSSINHLGYCLLGLFAVVKWTGADPQWSTERAAALNGVLLQMFNHGITAAALFCFIAYLERRGGSSELADFGGLRKAAPVFCGLMGISVFASLGLPGLNGFVGEFLIFKGVFPLAGWAAALSVLGLLATAIFLLTLLQRVWSGPLPERSTAFPDLTLAERAIVFPAVALMFAIGVYPQVLLQFTNSAVLQILEQIRN